MRKVIYSELERLHKLSGGFPYRNWRWGSFKDVKLEDITFGSFKFMDEYTDEELLQLYSLIYRQYCKQG